MTQDSNLTQSQLLIWTGQKLNPDAPLYNMCFLFELSGRLYLSVFEQAFKKMIEQTDSLRLVIHESDGVPMQSVKEQLVNYLEILDWSSENLSEKQYLEWAKRRSNKKFDLTDTMFDAVLIKAANEKFYWFFNQHHLITDGWSVTLLHKRLVALYEQILNDKEDEMVFPSYLNFHYYEKKLKQEQTYSEQAEYWKDKLKNLPAPSELYGQKSVVKGSSSTRLSTTLSKNQTDNLKALCIQPDLRAWSLDLSMFNIFTTVIFAYLYRVSYQKELVIGTPAHNRTSTDFKNTSGLIMELFPLMVQIEDEETFSSLFKKVQWETSSFLKNSVPGANNVEISRGFNVVLNFINASFSTFAGLPMKANWIHPSNMDEAHILRVQIHDFDESGELKLHFDINTDHFTEDVVKQIPLHFISLLDSFINDRFQRIDQPKITQNLALTEIEPPFDFESIINLFGTQVIKNSGKTAIKYKEESISFKQLDEVSDGIAHFLVSQGDENNKNIVILLPRSLDLITGILGVLKAGKTFIPIDSNFGSNRFEDIISAADPQFIITNEELVENIDKKFIGRALLIDQLESQTYEILPVIKPDNIAYILYTSGSTGKPKGVMVSHKNLSNYLQQAVLKYELENNSIVPLFTSIGFDLTITSLLGPLIAGSRIDIYKEGFEEPDLSIFQVLEDNEATFIKLTPSHLSLVENTQIIDSALKTMVVGGEDFKSQLASNIQRKFGGQIKIYNEYGPTEATVGCIVHQFSIKDDSIGSVPIGYAMKGVGAHVLTDSLADVPDGAPGQLYLSGAGIARGYWKNEELTKKNFLNHGHTYLYKTGDLVRVNQNGSFEFLGRLDEQVKLSGRRVELGEIENALNSMEEVENSVVIVKSQLMPLDRDYDVHCARCGLPSTYPDSQFDEEMVCGLCRSFESYQHRVEKYFKNVSDLQSILKSKKLEKSKYDCISLLSGGKDSTYALAKLVDMGLKVLAFTLDNGYISSQAKDNINRVVEALGVDHTYATTPSMNEIFVDSLERHANVCDGCFKTIYSLSMKIALEKNIPFIVTGLSRGQFFETRLTEELFRSDGADLNKIDDIILNARKAYHKVDDAVKKYIDVKEFENEDVFEKVQFIDFYRYTDVSLEEMLEYLDKKLPWQRPTDTGRSTNCLINAAGIYIHKKQKGFSNYAFPYSWDVRLGHKTRNESIEEINEEIHEGEVLQILDEIGYVEKEQEEGNELIAYYKSENEIKDSQFRERLQGLIADYMIPVQFVKINEIPLSTNGKVDKSKLPLPDKRKSTSTLSYVAPRNDIEEILAEIWCDVLRIDKVSVFDKFLDLGGSSLAAIRIISRANEAFELDLPLNLAFSKPTIAAFADFVRETIISLLEQDVD